MSWRNLENPENMYEAKRLLTLDANVFVAALKRDESRSDERANILNKIPTNSYYVNQVLFIEKFVE